MKKYKITQVKSLIGATDRQRRTMQALGIRKMHQTIEKEGTPQIEGMLEKLRHLIKIEEV
jgi:large subunit ribosomal protein L30